MTHNDGHARIWRPDAGKTALEWIDPLVGYPVAAIGKELDKKSNAGAAIQSLPIPVPQPPITPANPQVLAAQQNFAQATLGQKTVSDTIFAGNTGGWRPGDPGSPGNPVAPKGFKRGI